jgi:F-type H+-transporting ATPase subunit b
MELFTEASIILASNGSFGINTDIFETNLVNQLIILGGVVSLGRDFLSESLGQRQAEIISGVEDSEKRLNEATTRLAEAKNQLSQARVIMDQIKKETSETKAALLEADYNQAKLELSKRFSSASTILKFRERQILSEIKQYVSVLALELVVSKIEKKAGLETELNSYMQESINMVGAASPAPALSVEIGEEN